MNEDNIKIKRSKEELCDVWQGAYERLFSTCESAIKRGSLEFFESWFEAHRAFLQSMKENVTYEYEPGMCVDIFSEDAKIENCND